MSPWLLDIPIKYTIKYILFLIDLGAISEGEFGRCAGCAVTCLGLQIREEGTVRIPSKC